MLLTSLNFCLAGKLFYFSIKSKRESCWVGILGCRFFLFVTLNISCHSLLVCRVSVEKSADSLMGVHLVCYLLFFPCCFKYFVSVLLIFVSLITVCLGVFLLGLILPGTFCASWTWLTISFPMFGKFSAIIYSNIFSGPFSVSSGTPIMQILVCLMLSQKSLRLSSFLIIIFSIFYSVAVISTILSSKSFILSASVILILIPSSVLFISVCLFL